MKIIYVFRFPGRFAFRKDLSFLWWGYSSSTSEHDKTFAISELKSGSVELKGLLSRGNDIVIVIRDPVQVRHAEES